MILQPIVSSVVVLPVFEQLAGLKDGNNHIFKTSKKFQQTSTVTPLVIWQGRTLTLDVDYVVSESGGAGTGFDTISLISWSAEGHLPRANDSLFAFYFADHMYL